MLNLLRDKIAGGLVGSKNKVMAALHRLCNRINQKVQKYFGETQLEKEIPENAAYFISNFVWIITRSIVNFLLIFSPYKWNYKTQKFEMSNSKLRMFLMYCMFILHINLLMFNTIYIGICLCWELGKTEFKLSIAWLFYNLGVTMFQVQNLWHSETIPQLLNAAHELNLKAGKLINCMLYM